MFKRFQSLPQFLQVAFNPLEELNRHAIEGHVIEISPMRMIVAGTLIEGYGWWRSNMTNRNCGRYARLISRP